MFLLVYLQRFRKNAAINLDYIASIDYGIMRHFYDKRRFLFGYPQLLTAYKAAFYRKRRCHQAESSDAGSTEVLQVPLGHFGVTPTFLVNAAQLEIKIAQGAKPGKAKVSVKLVAEAGIGIVASNRVNLRVDGGFKSGVDVLWQQLLLDVLWHVSATQIIALFALLVRGKNFIFLCC
ncbi:hypothetical protein NE237_033304 [Protea cynaroides]|uniref:Glutamate synthase domain-containing protein n=1 Tax=Protea cynaroides TaxID=273540 RepID=A0A9Q0R4J4_9MAGN|nr:hypothetical protein NE237_033304 [Protea cynaroides]